MSCNCKKPACKVCNGGDNEYLLVKATASNAGCGPNQSSATANCLKQEPVFDEAVSGFIVPVQGENISFAVCNPSIYSEGQWIYFAVPDVYLRIVSVLPDSISVVSGCPDGTTVEGNPSPGFAISAGSRFTVTGKPRCTSESIKLEEVNKAFRDAEEVCTPALVESDLDSNVQLVGRVEAHDSNINFGKCLRRVRGVFAKMGSLFIPETKVIPVGAQNSFSRLGVNNTTGEVRKYQIAASDANHIQTFAKIVILSGGNNNPVLASMGQSLDVPQVGPPESTDLVLNYNNILSSINEAKKFGPIPVVELEFRYLFARTTAGGSVEFKILFNNALEIKELLNDGVLRSGIYTRLQPIMNENSVDTVKVTIGSAGNPAVQAFVQVRAVGIYV